MRLLSSNWRNSAPSRPCGSRSGARRGCMSSTGRTRRANRPRSPPLARCCSAYRSGTPYASRFPRRRATGRESETHRASAPARQTGSRQPRRARSICPPRSVRRRHAAARLAGTRSAGSRRRQFLQLKAQKPHGSSGLAERPSASARASARIEFQAQRCVRIFRHSAGQLVLDRPDQFGHTRAHATSASHVGARRPDRFQPAPRRPAAAAAGPCLCVVVRAIYRRHSAAPPPPPRRASDHDRR